MKVLQMAKFYPPNHGGMESVVATLAEGMVARGWPTDVLCTHRRWATRVEAGPGGGHIVRAGQVGMLLSTPLSPALLRRAAALVSAADLVHVHLPNPMAALALRLAPRPRRMLLHWHSDIVTQRLARRMFDPLERWLLRQADLVVTTSQSYLEASAQLAAFRAKATVVPLGIDANFAAVGPERVRAWKARFEGRRIVLAVGRLTGYKGFDVLIDAARELPQDVAVVIVGGGPLMGELQWRASLPSRGAAIRFTGPVDDADRDALLVAADLFCMPSTSRAEAFGVALLEAMAAGKAVVASDIPGSGVGWVNAAGLGVPPRDAYALARGLKRVLGDPGLAARMGRDARRRYLEHFTATGMIDRFDGLYRQLTAGREERN